MMRSLGKSSFSSSPIGAQISSCFLSCFSFCLSKVLTIIICSPFKISFPILPLSKYVTNQYAKSISPMKIVWIFMQPKKTCEDCDKQGIGLFLEGIKEGIRESAPIAANNEEFIKTYVLNDVACIAVNHYADLSNSLKQLNDLEHIEMINLKGKPSDHNKKYKYLHRNGAGKLPKLVHLRSAINEIKSQPKDKARIF